MKKREKYDDSFGLSKYDNQVFDDEGSEKYEAFRKQAEEERKKAEKDLIEQQFALRRNQKSSEEVAYFLAVQFPLFKIFYLIGVVSGKEK